MNSLYRVGDEVTIIKGESKEYKGKLTYEWGESKWLVDLLDGKGLTVCHISEMAPLNGDNQIYTERILQSMDDYL